MINLLDQETKQNRKANRSFKLLLIFFSALLFLAASTYLSAISIEQYLNAKNNTLDNDISQVSTKILKYRDLEKEINQTNSRLSQIKSLQVNQSKWSELIIKLANNTPQAIQINNLLISPQVSTTDKNTASSHQFTISGTAKTLDDIEIFRKTLDDSDTFTGSEFKSATFNKEKSNYSFSLSTKLKASK